MANTIEGSGTQTATITTEHILLTEAEAKNYIMYVNIAALVPGDELEIYIRMKVLSTDTAVIIQKQYIGPAMPEEEVVQTIPIAAPGHSGGLEFCLKQQVGTGRAFPWLVVSVG